MKHYFFVAEACDAGELDWSIFMESNDTDWVIIPCRSRERSQIWPS